MVCSLENFKLDKSRNSSFGNDLNAFCQSKVHSLKFTRRGKTQHVENFKENQSIRLSLTWISCNTDVMDDGDIGSDTTNQHVLLTNLHYPFLK